MIKAIDFLPRFSALTDEQRTVLTRQVLDFQTNVLPVIDTAEEPWSYETTSQFDEGLRLISTLSSAQNFCLVAYQYKNIRKRIEGFSTLFIQLLNQLVTSGDISEETSESQVTGRRQTTYTATPPTRLVIGSRFQMGTKTGKAGRPEKPKNIPKVPAAGVKVENTILVNADGSDPLQPTIAGRKTKDLRSYIHLLPESLQVEATKYIFNDSPDSYYLHIQDLGDKLWHLSEDDDPRYAKDRRYHAELICQTEHKLRNLWDRIDVAYAEATGKSVSPEYKQYLDQETLDINGVLKERAFAEMTKFEIDSMDDSNPAKAEAKEARINRDKKFLRKDDRKGDDQHRQNLIDAATELHEWGILITDTQAEVCKKYGYDVPQDWVELPLEERKKAQQQARNEKRKAERAKAREERKAQKEAEQAEAEAPYTGEGLSLFKE